MIQIERLTKTYGKARGVTELTLRVPEGSCYGFIGPNGAGKSTTIRTLLGLLAPTAGSARVLGLDCRRADALCQALDLDGRKRIRELSLGNRKKVSIVCAMQHRPRLYVLDEPTSGLDPLAQRTFWSLLEGRRQEGATVFLSSHVLSEIQRQCSRAAIIREGRLLREGAVAELTGAGTRRVTLRGGELRSQLPGAADLRREGDTASFLYSGSVDSLLEALRGRHLADLHITEPDLEEIFLHYYEGGDGQ